MGLPRGRKPKSMALKILEGNPGNRPLNDCEPGTDLPPVKPSIVAADELASLEWDRVIAAMPPGIYSALDVSVLSQYAMAWAMLVKAQDDLLINGFTFTFYDKDRDGNAYIAGVKANPAAKVWRLASETLFKTGDRLGLSPGVRTRLQLPSKLPHTPKSGFAGLIGRTPQSSER